MRSVQEDVLEKFLRDLRRGGTYNRKWWNPIDFSIYVHDLVRWEEIIDVTEVGTGNGLTAAWAALGGANVWTCDTVDRPKIWDADIFPLPHLKRRIECLVSNGDDFLASRKSVRKDRRELLVLDGPSGEKGFRRQWSSVCSFAKEGDFIVVPIGSQEIYNCFLTIRGAGFDVKYNTWTGSYTIKWPADGHTREW